MDQAVKSTGKLTNGVLKNFLISQIRKFLESNIKINPFNQFESSPVVSGLKMRLTMFWTGYLQI